MVFNTTRKPSNPFKSEPDNKIIEGKSINTFLGHSQAEGSNLLNYKFGELIHNKNMEWGYSSSSKFLRTKRGSTFYKDVILKALGAGVYYQSSVSYIVWVDNEGKLKYIDDNGDIQIITTGLNTAKRYEFWFYGLGSNETLYGCQENVGFFKVTMSGGALIYTLIFSTVKFSSMSFSDISGRMIGVVGHRAYYGDVQLQDAVDTTNLENFTTAKWVNVRPDQGDGIQRVVQNGQITFYFKDTGIWALVNAEEDIANWSQPQCSADVGTKSPDTVHYVKYGTTEAFVYLGTDKTLRLFTATIERNSGTTPTLKGGGSVVISNPFQKLLDDIPDGQVSKCNGYFFGNYYILNIISSGASEIDTTIVIDMDKLSSREEEDSTNQPYWFYTDNMEFTHYLKLGNQKVYGFHKQGYISELLVSAKYYEEVPDRITPLQEFRDYIVINGVTGTFVKNETITGASSGNTAKTTLEVSDTDLLVKNSTSSWSVGETITGSKSGATATVVSVVRRVTIEWDSYVAWYKYASNELKLYDAYLNYNIEGNWSINFSVNSFLLGETIPRYDQGINFELKPQRLGGAYFDSDYFNQAYFDVGVGQLSQNTGSYGSGHYFCFGFYSTGYNKWATIYSIEPRFETIKYDSIGKNY